MSQFSALNRKPVIRYVPVDDGIRRVAAIPATRDVLVSFGTDLARVSIDGALRPVENLVIDRWGDVATIGAVAVASVDDVVFATVTHVHRGRIVDDSLESRFSTPLTSEIVAGVALQVAVSDDGQTFAAVAADYLVSVVGTDAVQVHTDDNYFWGVALSTDGSVLANGRDDGTVELRDPATLELRRTLTGLTATVLSIGFSPDGHLLAAGDDLGQLYSWDLENGRQRQHDLQYAKAVNIAWLPDGSGFLGTGLTRMVGVFSADGSGDEIIAFEGLGARYLQDATLVNDHTLVAVLEDHRMGDPGKETAPPAACVMVVDLG